MPHITQQAREAIRASMRNVNYEEPGQLVYVFTVMLCRLWNKKPRFSTLFEAWRYKHTLVSQVLEQTNPTFSFEDARAAFELSFLDFYDRVGKPYELKKAQENGDVYVEEGVIKPQGERP